MSKNIKIKNGRFSLKPISKNYYLLAYSTNKEIMTFYEECLIKINPNLSLTTTLKELPNIFSINEEWNRILNDRINKAPSKKSANEWFEKELLSLIEFDEDAGIDSKINETKYWNRFRKIAYEFYASGQIVMLQGLGYLMLRDVYENVGNNTIFTKNVSNVIGIKDVLISLAEGVAIAEFFHSEKQKPLQKIVTNNVPQTFDELFFERYRTPEIIELFINVLREVDPPLINDNNVYVGRYKTGFVIWINKLKGIFVSSENEKTYARLLNSKFNGLNLGKDAGMFRKLNKASYTYKEYERAIENGISTVKISLPKLP